MDRPVTTDEAQLRSELYGWAAALPRSGWYTTRYQEFESMVLALDRSRLQAFERRIEDAWDNYYGHPLAYEERTAETVVGHRLLVEGLAGWMRAIQLFREGFEAGEILSVAESANRLLLAVQYQAERLGRQVTPGGG